MIDSESLAPHQHQHGEQENQKHSNLQQRSEEGAKSQIEGVNQRQQDECEKQRHQYQPRETQVQGKKAEKTQLLSIVPEISKSVPLGSPLLTISGKILESKQSVKLSKKEKKKLLSLQLASNEAIESLEGHKQRKE
ncbi:hypothetical protein QJS10_CPB21g00476 [Acorus calamus]|uniref:Uncharacterized protein n=1 Tax=Acorus calamus TaxID=4465 RepID=A0AAV9C6T7_ACOCL|nr:hypothetical protein QJS10_CPB21g00476 [Acorus calamus]